MLSQEEYQRQQKNRRTTLILVVGAGIVVLAVIWMHSNSYTAIDDWLYDTYGYESSDNDYQDEYIDYSSFYDDACPQETNNIYGLEKYNDPDYDTNYYDKFDFSETYNRWRHD